MQEDAPDAGLNAGPGSAETVALELSALERQELARLLAVNFVGDAVRDVLDPRTLRERR